MASEVEQWLNLTMTLVGDVMLGRLIDQLLPTHVDEPEEAQIVSHLRQRHPHLQRYTYSSPWGNVPTLFQKSDLVLGNLETSITTSNIKWPDKVFNYRMHPDNVSCLTQAGFDYVSLANNHTLDFSQDGLSDTIRVLKKANIAYAGAGEAPEDASRPAILNLRPLRSQVHARPEQYKVHVYAFSDHPNDWNVVEEFNLLQYTASYKQKLRDTLISHSPPPSLKVVSIHWGPNYRWQPDQEIRDMAQYLIDDCGVDVVWGHSSHHIQGVEIHAGKPIIYGCGDFLDDYAVNRQFRNDLSAAWSLKFRARGNQLQLKQLEVWPNRIKQFQAHLLQKEDADHGWVTKRFRQLCAELGTIVQEDLGSDDQVIVNLP